jgi:coproporphyrinogen III oxidase-like Fe-S oxidoreductase
VTLGVYIHFPWCRKLCPYCDFAVAVAVEPPHDAYLAAVIAELDARAADVAGRTLAARRRGGGRTASPP